ncbi:alpha-1,2-fucosyltransferase [Roseibium sp.]|uniref:alpha-1,2-fucosyltransferase n=1 Tax=Roseibium sp. TaxID=1936156 RepID=UPI003A987BB8
MNDTKPVITFSQLGRLGRFANHCLQYMFLSAYADKHGLEFKTSHWTGERIFNVKRGTDDLPPFPRVEQQTDDFQTCEIAGSAQPLCNIDLSGYFQYNLSYYAGRQDKIREEFSFTGHYESIRREIAGVFSSYDAPVVCLHLRRGDYGYSHFFVAPNKWYIAELKRLKSEIGNFVVYIATDDVNCIGQDFNEFQVITSANLRASLSTQVAEQELHFLDFIALTQGDMLAISNSSFSFFASLLNTKASKFLRPSLAAMKLIDYDPWASDPILRDQTVEQAGSQFMNPALARKARRKRWRNLVREPFKAIAHYFGS